MTILGSWADDLPRHYCPKCSDDYLEDNYDMAAGACYVCIGDEAIARLRKALHVIESVKDAESRAYWIGIATELWADVNHHYPELAKAETARSE